MDAQDELVIHSYRTVFSFEWRLYRFDRWRLPLRGGLPVRALLYAPAVYLVLLAADRVPLLGGALRLLPAPLHWALAPLGLVAALLHARLDGRAVHRALWALARWRLSPRLLGRAGPLPPPPRAL